MKQEFDNNKLIDLGFEFKGNSRQDEGNAFVFTKNKAVVYLFIESDGRANAVVVPITCILLGNFPGYKICIKKQEVDEVVSLIDMVCSSPRKYRELLALRYDKLYEELLNKFEVIYKKRDSILDVKADVKETGKMFHNLKIDRIYYPTNSIINLLEEIEATFELE